MQKVLLKHFDLYMYNYNCVYKNMKIRFIYSNNSFNVKNYNTYVYIYIGTTNTPQRASERYFFICRLVGIFIGTRSGNYRLPAEEVLRKEE